MITDPAVTAMELVLIFVIAGLLWFLPRSLTKRLNPLRRLQIGLCGGAILLALFLWSDIATWLKIVISGAVTYEIYRRFQAYRAYRTADNDLS